MPGDWAANQGKEEHQGRPPNLCADKTRTRRAASPSRLPVLFRSTGRVSWGRTFRTISIIARLSTEEKLSACSCEVRAVHHRWGGAKHPHQTPR